MADRKRIGIGFIGGGFITRFHLQSMVAVRDMEVLGITSRSIESAESAAALARSLNLGPAKAYASVTEMIADPAIDALWICAPNYTRIAIFEEICQAVVSGKGSLIGIACEKPLGRNVAEARLVRDLALKELRPQAGPIWRVQQKSTADPTCPGFGTANCRVAACSTTCSAILSKWRATC